jgi:hypothetical protein
MVLQHKEHRQKLQSNAHNAVWRGERYDARDGPQEPDAERRVCAVIDEYAPDAPGVADAQDERIATANAPAQVVPLVPHGGFFLPGVSPAHVGKQVLPSTWVDEVQSEPAHQRGILGLLDHGIERSGRRVYNPLFAWQMDGGTEHIRMNLRLFDI